MRSLFAKILVWFLITTALTGLAFFVTSALMMSETRNRHFPMSQLMRVEMREARHAWETGGKDALSATLGRFFEGGPARGFLAGADGRDLLTGQDMSGLIAQFAPDGSQQVFDDERMRIGRRTDDGKFWYVIDVPRRRFFLPLLQVNHLWILGIVVLLCYGLARHLTAPLRQLQTTMKAFGQGDLTARVSSRRRDDFGLLANNFDRMADRIQSLMSAQKQLLQDISHELRSPLARLSLATELARTGDDREAAIDRIEKEADRLNHLVGELLQVTRVEGDPNALHSEPVRLDLLIGEVVDDCDLEATARGCTIGFGDAPVVTLMGDAELLRRAVENVLRNAIRHSPPASEVTVELKKTAPDKISVAIADRGPGVPEETLDRIFEPFYRVEHDRGRTSGGTGLGLAIARRAIAVHKGQIRASNTNPGLRVEIELGV